jgi:hypothetical protein
MIKAGVLYRYLPLYRAVAALVTHDETLRERAVLERNKQ